VEPNLQPRQEKSFYILVEVLFNWKSGVRSIEGKTDLDKAREERNTFENRKSKSLKIDTKFNNNY